MFIKYNGIFAFVGSAVAVAVVVMGFLAGNTWEVAAGNFMLLWVHEAYERNELCKAIDDAIAEVKVDTEKDDNN